MTAAACFQHPERDAEIVLTFYEGGRLVEFAMCHNCRQATAIACLVHEGLIHEPYEIIDINEDVG